MAGRMFTPLLESKPDTVKFLNDFIKVNTELEKLAKSIVPGFFSWFGCLFQCCVIPELDDDLVKDIEQEKQDEKKREFKRCAKKMRDLLTEATTVNKNMNYVQARQLDKQVNRMDAAITLLEKNMKTYGTLTNKNAAAIKERFTDRLQKIKEHFGIQPVASKTLAKN